MIDHARAMASLARIEATIERDAAAAVEAAVASGTRLYLSQPWRITRAIGPAPGDPGPQEWTWPAVDRDGHPVPMAEMLARCRRRRRQYLTDQAAKGIAYGAEMDAMRQAEGALLILMERAGDPG